MRLVYLGIILAVFNLFSGVESGSAETSRKEIKSILMNCLDELSASFPIRANAAYRSGFFFGPGDSSVSAEYQSGFLDVLVKDFNNIRTYQKYSIIDSAEGIADESDPILEVTYVETDQFVYSFAGQDLEMNASTLNRGVKSSQLSMASVSMLKPEMYIVEFINAIDDSNSWPELKVETDGDAMNVYLFGAEKFKPTFFSLTQYSEAFIVELLIVEGGYYAPRKISFGFSDGGEKFVKLQEITIDRSSNWVLKDFEYLSYKLNSANLTTKLVFELNVTVLDETIGVSVFPEDFVILMKEDSKLREIQPSSGKVTEIEFGEEVLIDANVD